MSATPAQAQPQPPRVLVVEDDPAIARRLVGGLREAGFDVALACDGETGARTALAEPFALVVLDLQLPGMHGLEVLELWSGHMSAPVIVLTSSSELQARIKVFDLGAVDYMPKPFWIEELVARIRARSATGAPVRSIPGFASTNRPRGAGARATASGSANWPTATSSVPSSDNRCRCRERARSPVGSPRCAANL